MPLWVQTTSVTSAGPLSVWGSVHAKLPALGAAMMPAALVIFEAGVAVGVAALGAAAVGVAGFGAVGACSMPVTLTWPPPSASGPPPQAESPGIKKAEKQIRIHRIGGW